MSAGWVLVQAVDGAAPAVAEVLAALPGVASAERTAGAYDVVARVRDLGDAVPSARHVVRAAMRVPGVTLAVACHDAAGGAGGGTVVDLRDLAGPEALAAEPASDVRLAPAGRAAAG
jgi:hypothetical protein